MLVRLVLALPSRSVSTTTPTALLFGSEVTAGSSTTISATLAPSGVSKMTWKVLAPVTST